MGDSKEEENSDEEMISLGLETGRTWSSLGLDWKHWRW
jgi:hypothetical protein